MYIIKRKKWIILDNMSKECMRLTASCAILGVGVDGGGIRPADGKKPQ